MRRILLVLSVAALMVAMLVVMAVPAFADSVQSGNACFGDSRSQFAQDNGQVWGQEAAARQGTNAKGEPYSNLTFLENCQPPNPGQT